MYTILKKIGNFFGFYNRSAIDEIWQALNTIEIHIRNAGIRLDNDQQAINEIRDTLENFNSKKVIAEGTSYNLCDDNILKVEKLYQIKQGAWLDQNNCPTFTNMELESGRLIASLVALYRPNIILETGTHQGYSAMLMANAMRSFNIPGHVFTMDPFKVAHLFDKSVISEYVTWVNDYSYNYREYNLPSNYDMILLDSDHTYKTLAYEVETFEPMLKTGGLMILHDTVVYKDLWPVIHDIKQSKRFEVITFETPRNWCRDDRNGSGITICKKINNGLPIKLNAKYEDTEEIERLIESSDFEHYLQSMSQHSVYFKKCRI